MALPDLDPIEITETVSPPDVKELTTKSVDGTGVFDVLMKTVKLHLLEEFDSDRITGAQYSEVYLGALGAVLQQSISYIASHHNTRKVNADIGLVRQQIVTELANTCDTIPENLGFNNTTLVEGVVQAQLTKLTKENLVLDAQIVKMGKENQVLDEQIIKIGKDGLLVDAQTATAANEKNLIGQKTVTELAQTSDLTNLAAAASALGFNGTLQGIQGVTKAQLDKIAMDTKLTGQQVVTELAQTGDVNASILDGVGINNPTETTIGGVIEAQIGKITMDKNLVSQQILTELANTEDMIPKNMSAEAKALGFNSFTETHFELINDVITEVDNPAQGLASLQATKLIKEAGYTWVKANAELAKVSDKVFATWDSVTADADLKGTMGAEMQLLAQKKATEYAQTGILAETMAFIPTAIEGVMGAQTEKIKAEEALLTQKKETELAQVAETVATGAVAGVIGKQKLLFAAQTAGFSRDAEQKAAKIATDAWTVDRTLGDRVISDTSRLTDTYLGGIMDRLRAGINAETVPTVP